MNSKFLEKAVRAIAWTPIRVTCRSAVQNMSGQPLIGVDVLTMS